LEGLFGTGSTIFIQTSASENKFAAKNEIVVSSLDEQIPKQKGQGALWLDVEGSAVPVLQGASRILKQITIAQIEIDMHTQSKERIQNYRAVLDLMNAEGFFLVAAPLHPGYFGDVLFVKLKKRNILLRAKSLLLFFAMITLHSVIYPLLNKPERFKVTT
jgi:hypothetical protein